MTKKIILGLISTSVLISLIYFTYMIDTFSDYEKPYYEETKLGLFELEKNEENTFSIKDIDEENTNEENIFIQKINISDNIIFSNGKIKRKAEGGNTKISLEQGIYLLNLKEVNTNYIVNGLGFEINNLGPGSFFINNLDQNNIIVFSINTLLDLKLKNINTNEYINNISLYPNTYLVFNPEDNNSVKNSDLLKISQIFTLGYFNGKILSENIASEKFLKLISLNNTDHFKLISDSLLFLKQDIDNGIKYIDDFIDYSFINLPGEDYINKYIALFVNPDKKSIYYKNLIIRSLNKLLENNEIDLKNINTIAIYLEKLKKLDEEGYIEIKEIINFYYSSIIKTNKDFNIKINFTELHLRINNGKLNLKLKSLVNLENLYFKFNFLEKSEFYNEIGLFINEYINDLNIEIKSNETELELELNNESKIEIDICKEDIKKVINKYEEECSSNNQIKDKIEKNSLLDINNIEKTEYLLFFLENILLTSDFSSSNIDLENLLMIFNAYVEISNSFYTNSNNITIKKTGIYTNSDILNRFDEIIKNIYFKEDRNENNILEYRDNVEIIKKEVLSLEKNINKIINFYENNKNLICGNNSNIAKIKINQYYSFKEIFKEYFSALKNNGAYIAEYDLVVKKLKCLNNTNTEKINISKEEALKYLEYFNGLSFNNSTIKIMDYNYCINPIKENEDLEPNTPYCYKVENLNIDGNNVSFLLLPFERNKIEEIVINNISKSSSFKLDDERNKIENASKSSSKKEYKFEDFLVSILGKSTNKTEVTENENTNETEVTEDEDYEEDRYVKTFKRQRLFDTDNGEFSYNKLGRFLDIKYNDVFVKRSENNIEYTIDIKNASFITKYGENQYFGGLFNSSYDIYSTHSFINPNIKLIDEKSEKDLLIGNYIYIKGTYKIDKISSEFSEIFKHYRTINNIVKESNKYLRKTVLEIKYIKDLDLVKIEIPFSGSTVYIEVKEQNIIKAIYNGKKIINSPIDYNKAYSLFDNLR